MDFITNYWVILLVLFILILLIILSYLIDKEIRKMKDDDISDDIFDDKLESTDTDDSPYLTNYSNQTDKLNTEPVNVDDTNKDKLEIAYSSEELDYDELDIEDIDDDFNRVIRKKKLIDTSIMESVEAMEVSDIEIDKEKKEEEITLPEIKIKKDVIDNIWE